MSNKLFTSEEQELLSQNPHIKKVTSKSITYTDEFRELASIELESGKGMTQIFKEAGLNPKLLGRERINSFSSRIKRMAKRPEGFTDTRKYNSGRPVEKIRTEQEEIAYLRTQLLKRDQEIEVLKKTITINRRAKQRQNKSSPSSKKS